MHEDLVNSTVRVEALPSTGSGFHYVKPEIIVTNHHVIEPHIMQNVPVDAVTEHGARMPLELLAHSPKNQYDFAILRINGDIPESCIPLKAKALPEIIRGTDILFSGFPHGIHHLLVHRAIISGKMNDTAFYIDGSVNGGNSGGPIIDANDQKLIGIVTQRRFLGVADMDAISNESKQLQDYCQGISGGGSVNIMGINFTEFAKLMAHSLVLIDQVIHANANSGIGVGFHIRHVVAKCEELGIT